MSAEIQIEGLKGLQETLEKLAKKDSRRITRRGIAKIGQVIRKEMRNRAPIKTGLLRNSIGYKTFRSVGGFRGTVGPGPKVFYARFLEYGAARHFIPSKNAAERFVVIGGKVFSRVDHPGTSPRPFLRPAYDAVKVKAVEECGKLMWELIKKAAVKQ